MNTLANIVFLVAGLVIGGIIVRLWLGAKSAAAAERLNSYGQQWLKACADLDVKTNEVNILRDQLSCEATKRSAAEQLNARVPELQADIAAKDQRMAVFQNENTDLKKKLSEYETRLAAEKKAADEKIALLNEAKENLSNVFKALSADALKDNSQVFLDLAKGALEKFQETAKGDLEKRQQAINELVRPVGESLEKFDVKINELEKTRAVAYGELSQQVKSLIETEGQLRSETGKLVTALRAPKTRGNWGEMQLKRVVEMAGMLDRCDFAVQQSLSTEEGRLQLDLIVNLPGNKKIVIDAKTPSSSYLEACEATDDNVRIEKLKEHARQTRDRINELGKKSYWKLFQPGPNFVVLFLPGENLYYAALEHDPALIEIGVEQGVLLATPVSLIGLLRVIEFGWRQEAIERNAQEISELGRELYDRIVKMREHWGKVGKGLGNAVEAYDEAVGTLEKRVLVCARKFKELGAATRSEIEELAPIGHIPRAIQAPEMSDQSTECEEGNS